MLLEGMERKLLKSGLFGLAGLLLFLGSGCREVGNEDVASRQRIFIDSLMSEMSLEDKVGEMTQLTLGALAVGTPYDLNEPQQLDEEKMRSAFETYRVGSVLNCGNHAHTPEKWHEFIVGIQTAAASKPTGIPVLYGVDAIHGPTYTSYGALGPQQIGLAATWNEDLVRKAAENTAQQIFACGIPWNFSPVLDLGRDPRWPRFWETFGEDPLLVSRLGVAMVRGYQEGPQPVAATLKHFFGYGFTLTGKDRTPAWIPERELREYFLPSFEAAIDAGAMSIMVNSGEINGIPVHANRYLLTDLLRGELGFDGVLVTDWEDVRYLFTRHMVAADYKEATRMAIDAGIDMSMVPLDFGFSDALLDLVREGSISMERIDQSVRRILTMKWKLGLFETGGFPPALDAYPGLEDFEGAAARAALESMTLLKNEVPAGRNQAALPISGNGKIFVTGPTANSLNALNGGWTGTWQGTDTLYNTPGSPTLLGAMTQRFGADRVLSSDLEMDFTSTDIERLTREIGRTNPDYVVLGLGEMPYTEIPGNDEDLSLYANQKELIRALQRTGVPLIGVFIEGRPRTFSDVEPLLDAVLMAYLPGDFGGDAIAQVLEGAYNPSGKLPFTWPRHPSSHLTYDHKYTEQIHTDFSLNAFNPQYEFGFGLNYSPVEFSNLFLDRAEYGLHDTINVSIDLFNAGDRTTNELVMAFSQDRVASITPSVNRLRAFERVLLGGGEKSTIKLEIPVQSLSFVNASLEDSVEPGSFGIRVGSEVVEIQILK